jgi:group II intron reverse transcriptase/maturase
MTLRRWPKVEELREKLNGKAKAEKTFRFYLLYDKVYRKDFLEAAYAKGRANDGAPGVDGETFEDIEAYGVDRYLEELARELKELRYQPGPVRRVMIEKENQPGKYRPLGIPNIRDRIVQQAVVLLLSPIFEADFPDEMYGYREGRSAQEAVQEVDEGLRNRWVNVVDADLTKYFDTIPHDQLMRSVERRVADRKVLWLIRAWLKVPVHETNARGRVVVTGGRKTKEGTPQGGVISPLLANIYFRRVLVAWKARGYDQQYESRIVNYADDFVILCRRDAQGAYQAARRLISGIGLTLNEQKTRVVRAWNNPFNFLGFTFGQQYGKGGKGSLGKWPSAKNTTRYREKIRALTARDQTWKRAEEVVQRINQTTTGFWQYFRIGTTTKVSHDLDDFVYERVNRWAQQKYKRPRHSRDSRQAHQKRNQAIACVLKQVTRSRNWLRAYKGGPLFCAERSYAQ